MFQPLRGSPLRHKEKYRDTKEKVSDYLVILVPLCLTFFNNKAIMKIQKH
jgi:hypothetical protein